MEYSLEELINSLKNKIFELGINPKLVRNPAFQSILLACVFLDCDNCIQNIETVKTEGQFSFKFLNSQDENIVNLIFKNENDGLKFVSIKEGNKKEVLETVVDADDYGRLSVKKTFVTIDIDSNLYTQTEGLEYTKDGVMTEREIKKYKTLELPSSVDLNHIDIIINAHRLNLNNDTNFENSYLTRIVMSRVTIDTARVFVDDNRGEGFNYSAILPLSGEGGFKNLNLPSKYPEEVTILPISKRKIDAMLKRESNKRVRNGLECYAKDRETFYYSSFDDVNFICKKKNSNNQK